MKCNTMYKINKRNKGGGGETEAIFKNPTWKGAGEGGGGEKGKIRGGPHH